MTKPISPAQISDEQAVKDVYPHAYAYGHHIYSDGGYDKCIGDSWSDARSRIEPVEEVSTTPKCPHVGPGDYCETCDTTWPPKVSTPLPQQEEPAKEFTFRHSFVEHPMVSGCFICGKGKRDPSHHKPEPIPTPLLGQDEPALPDDLIECIQEISRLRSELTQALTSLAAANAQNEEKEEMLTKWVHRHSLQLNRTEIAEASRDMHAINAIELMRQKELAEASLAEAQKEVEELKTVIAATYKDGYAAGKGDRR